MQQPKKDPSIPSGGFQYDVDAALAASVQDGTMHEWVLCKLRALCRRYGLLVRGNKADVLVRVVRHVASKLVYIIHYYAHDFG